MCYDVKRPGELGFVIQLDQKFSAKIRWEYSKRLLFGSLLLFTKDDFHTFQLATVSDRKIENLKKGFLNVCIVGDNIFGNEILTNKFVMAESSAFFEPVYQTLNTIQGLPIDKLPMQKYILVHDVTPVRPAYLNGITHVKISGRSVDIDNDVLWPRCEELGFNESQIAAFKSSLRNEFVVIQGPPGTGKTYLGLQIAKTLLNNISFKSPILMVCYTNHALDQFLEGLLDVTKSIIRIGGQSKNEALNEFNLINVRKKHRFSRHPSIPTLKDAMTKSLSIISSCNKLMEDIKKRIGIIDILQLTEVKLKGLEYFENSLDFVYWLLGDNYEYICGLKKLITQTEIMKKEKLAASEIQGNNIDFNDDDDEDELYRLNYFDTFNDVEDLVTVNDVNGGIMYYCLTLDTLQHIFNCLENTLYGINGENKDELKQRILFDLQTVTELKNTLTHRLNNTGMKPSKHYNELLKENLFSLSENDKWALYHYWINGILNHVSQELFHQQAEYNKALDHLKEIKIMEDYETLKSINPSILGLTTTGAARHHSLIAALKPPIIIVEEAAEVLEGHIIVSLTGSCQQLILIGDHKQLRPSPSTFMLAKRYNLDISLFERMLKNGVGCNVLTVQHRMKPNIAALITPSIYAELINHHTVEDYPPIRGIPKNLFFIKHNIFEKKDDDMESHCNPHEAEFMITLCRHLILQGYDPSDITILTTYSSQQYYLRDLKKQNSLLKEVRITVVDNYQGEECKIILLSLVRSNKDGKIGFLSIDNRVCVALSRAKHGLYIIGNMDNLTESSGLWKQINDTLEKSQSVGNALSLVCQIHDVETKVKCAKDFDQVIEGGCSLMCRRLMPCGHNCRSLCHTWDVEHTKMKCHQPCLQEICTEVGHTCPLRCYAKCQPCKVIMTRSLPDCEHKALIECHINPAEYQCRVEVADIKPDCQHKVSRYCFMDVAKVRCETLCDNRLDCGHSCANRCHVQDDPHHSEYKCMKPCTKINADCKSNHACQRRCWEDCGTCLIKMKRTLVSCGHTHQIACSMDPATFICGRNCDRIMNCGHKCKKLCHEPCGGCKEKVQKIIPGCGHKITVECSMIPSRSMCRAACPRTLKCGHPCKLKCSQDCDQFDNKCREYVPSPVPPACGHAGQVICHEAKTYVDSSSDRLLRYCKEPCNMILPCNDVCKGTCGDCMQGRIHQVCMEDCGNILICGHKCAVPCRDDCPPCKKMCLYRCTHSKCNRKCGAPCVSCKEKCPWMCVHLQCGKLCGELCDREPCYEPCSEINECGHPCIGFCGEPCPPLCRICNKEEVTEIFFGDEDDDDSRFIYLNDCNHVLESKGLEQWMSMDPADGKDRQIGVKCCPKCKTPVITTLRFMNAVKNAFFQVQTVKSKIFGREEEIRALQKQLLDVNLPCVEALIIASPNFVKENDNVKCVYSFLKSILTKIRSLNKKRAYDGGGAGIKLLEFISIFAERMITEVHRMSYLELVHPHKNLMLIRQLMGKVETQQLYKEIVVERFHLIFHHLSQRRSKISNNEVKQFQMEFNRFTRFIDYVLIMSNHQDVLKSDIRVKDVRDRLVAELKSVQPYSIENDIIVVNILKELKLKIHSSFIVSEAEKEMVFKAMGYGLRQGHWLQCSKGHYYVIGDCGGATSTGRCIECKETVGGRGYNIVSTSRRI